MPAGESSRDAKEDAQELDGGFGDLKAPFQRGVPFPGPPLVVLEAAPHLGGMAAARSKRPGWA